MRSSGIHHVGVAVPDLDEAVATWERLFGAELEVRAKFAEHGVELAMLRIGEGRVELLTGLGPDTPVGQFLENRGPGMHHVAFEVDDVAVELERLAVAGAELIDQRPRPGLEGRDIAFVHPDTTGGVLTELVGRG